MKIGSLWNKSNKPLFLEFAEKSEKGDREENQDFINLYADVNEGVYCFGLADGLGGQKAGRAAARMALEFLLARLCQTGVDATPDTMIEGLAEANDHLREAGDADPELEGMQATCCVALIQGVSACFASVGDSRIYLFRGGEILYRSRDDSVVQMLLDMGEISEAEIPGHPDRNRILKALGMEGDFRLGQEPFATKLQNGDYILICSDGLWENFSDAELSRIMSPRPHKIAPSRILEGIFRVAKTRAQQQGRKLDNLSAQLVTVSE